MNKRRLEGTFSVAKWLRHVSTAGAGGTKILHAARKPLPKTRTKEGGRGGSQAADSVTLAGQVIALLCAQFPVCIARHWASLVAQW